MASEAGKGDKDRTADRKAFGANYDAIFRKDSERLKNAQIRALLDSVQLSSSPPVDTSGKKIGLPNLNIQALSEAIAKPYTLTQLLKDQEKCNAQIGERLDGFNRYLERAVVQRALSRLQSALAEPADIAKNLGLWADPGAKIPTSSSDKFNEKLMEFAAALGQRTTLVTGNFRCKVNGIDTRLDEFGFVAQPGFNYELDLFDPRNCGNCKHWGKSAISPLTNSCRNFVVNDMIGADSWRRFEPPKDFGCSEWEAKP